jgi:hypothetical protein
MTTTTAPTKATIISQIEDYFQKQGGKYPDWYCGIASNARSRLFNDHNVAEVGGTWIYQICENDTVAREIEEHFLDLRMDGGGGGGDSDTKFVYAYKKTNYTKQ